LAFRHVWRRKTLQIELARLVLWFLGMEPAGAAAIDLVEAAYNLEAPTQEWLPNLLRKGESLFDRGLGCAAVLWAGRSQDRLPIVTHASVGSKRPELGPSFSRALREPHSTSAQALATNGGGVRVAAESELERPNFLWTFERHIGCPDVLGLWATSADFHGVGVIAPSPDPIALKQHTRLAWRRIAAHIEAGHRLRSRLGSLAGRAHGVDFPSEDAAVIDPRDFQVAHAEGAAGEEGTRQALRAAAIRIDKSRGRLRREDPATALAAWHALVRGRWSLIDWFDADGRRFVVALPNEPGTVDPRGLTKREHQVAALAAEGETGKRIGYQLGISRQRVSASLSSAMRKLGVRTQAELVMKLRGFEPRSKVADEGVSM
jgi:DNA-binding CsgD family transcriptional regulator